jgi:hypothetical protein
MRTLASTPIATATFAPPVSKSTRYSQWQGLGQSLLERVFHPTPPFATLLGFQLLLFSHTRLETVGDSYIRFLGRFSPPIVPFRPSFLRFESSDIHVAGPSASTPHFLFRHYL